MPFRSAERPTILGGARRSVIATTRVPLPYYRRLSKRDKAIYRASDRIAELPLPDAGPLRPLAREIRAALSADDRMAVERVAHALCEEVIRQLETEQVSVRVLSVRPSDAEAELHGLYVREEGKRAIIQVWMRTAAREQVVRYRTFLRTLLHELLHHLDYAHFGLADSFHTEGFFRRESSLMRQIAPRPPKAAAKPAGKAGKAASARVTQRKQLDLPL